MAKQRRPTQSRVARKKKVEKKPARKAVAERPARTAPATRVPSPPEPPRPKEPPSPPAKKPAYYEAIALYERGVQALQRHNYPAAAEHFRTVIDRYPDERELVERARLYLRVCERETSRQPANPTTPEERVYAATVSLNSGDHDAALEHLNKALNDDPDSDHAHYIMAVALSARGRREPALEHLRQSIALNPENRALARQDPDLETLRDHEAFRTVLETPADTARRRARTRR
jgi:tetratricopeptide (TPR) repeat protein